MQCCYVIVIICSVAHNVNIVYSNSVTYDIPIEPAILNYILIKYCSNNYMHSNIVLFQVIFGTVLLNLVSHNEYVNVEAS